jgi:lysosomal Pro-X carboxypeptidase
MLVVVVVVVTAGNYATTADAAAAAAVGTVKRTLAPGCCVYPVDEYFFPTVMDHYRFRTNENTGETNTFALRYFVNQQHWNNETKSGPVLFYAGNEANIVQFINNSGFLFEAAAELRAMVVFAEHRYYGESIPNTNNSANAISSSSSSSCRDDDSSFWDYLSVEQAMMDFNTLTVHIREQWNMTSSSKSFSTTPFIVLGGSYGANLALWLRLRHSNIWAGAIASFATPLKHILRETNDFYRIETEAYGNVSAHCPGLVRRGWQELYQGAAARDAGTRAAVAHALGLCHPLPYYNSNNNNNDNDAVAEHIHGWISGALETMVQYVSSITNKSRKDTHSYL